MKIKPTPAIRGILTIALLGGVWINAHWTVALAITLLALNDTLIRYVLGKEMEYRKQRQKAEHNLFRKLKKMKESMKK